MASPTPTDSGPAFPDDSGGAAFPINGGYGDNQDNGMSLRDWFAGRAPWVCGPMDDLKTDVAARYKWADAMLAERAKGSA